MDSSSGGIRALATDPGEIPHPTAREVTAEMWLRERGPHRAQLPSTMTLGFQPPDYKK